MAAPEVSTLIALDGYEAGRLVQTFAPQVVLLDLMMPGLDGFEVCERIKQDPTTRNTRVLAMTGLYTPENEVKILGAGAEYCLAKPIHTDLLLSCLGFKAAAQVDAE